MDHCKDWARCELLAWKDRGQSKADVERDIDALLNVHPCLFRYDLRGDEVVCHEKPQFFLGEGVPESFPKVLLDRAHLYRNMFERVMRDYEIDIECSLAIDVNDMPPLDTPMPIFTFQKRWGSRPILLPDVDLVGLDYFESSYYTDVLPFGGKRDAAIFVGSTSGGHITTEVVRDLALPRLRAAVFFKGSEDVVFRLPQIVQCDRRETREAIEALGVGGAIASWPEQFAYKYMLSMDGNGATCSRVAIALKSHCVLAKYDSPHQLFYFRGLEPWRNFVPISDDADVEQIVADGRSHPRHYENIARNGQEFFERHLTRAASDAYVAELLLGYRELLTRPVIQNRRAADAGVSALHLRAVLHVQDVGDVESATGSWLNDPRLNRRIEGFRLYPPPSLPDLKLRYRCVNAEGEISADVETGEFCGSSGEGKPVLGFAIEIASMHDEGLQLRYQGLFSDGEMTPFLEGGELCRGKNGAPLKSFKVQIVRLR